MNTIKNVAVNTWTSEDKHWINAIDLVELMFYIDDETERATLRSILEKYDAGTHIGVTLVDDRFGYGYTQLEIESICTPCLRFADSDEPEDPWTLYVTIPEDTKMKVSENKDASSS